MGMVRPRKPSPQAIALLDALLSRPLEWRYGYDLGKQVGLKSGSLYPLLMRLTDQGWLDAEWHTPSRPGLPPRHAYRLTESGCSHARAAIEAAAVSRGAAGWVAA